MTQYRTTIGPGEWRTSMTAAVLDAIQVGGTGRMDEIERRPHPMASGEPPGHVMREWFVMRETPELASLIKPL